MRGQEPTRSAQDSEEEASHQNLAFKPMADKTFSSFSTFIQTELGISMPAAKKFMLQSRLQKRLQALGIETFEEYHDYVFSPAGRERELSHLISRVTTNKTDFFRDPHHFEYLTQEAFPRVLRRKGRGIPVKIWSAGCSTGEEPYTLAIVLSELKIHLPELRFSILATDVSENVLEKAELGIYPLEKIEPIPNTLRAKYFLRSKEKPTELVRVTPEIRALVTFRQLNLMDQDFGIRESQDIIFFRNVLIYFDRTIQQMVLDRLCRYLKPGGYLFTGHSETLNGFDLPLRPLAHTIYKKIVKTYTEEELPILQLNPGELLVTDKPAIVRTVLGSCIAITMFNRRLRVAAICHALLPRGMEQLPDEDHEGVLWKHVDTVIPEMVRQMQTYGIFPKEIEVKLFGGADVLISGEGQYSNPTVGRMNVNVALRTIEAEQLQIRVSDVGGSRGRKIFFYTHTGEVLLKRLHQDE